MTTIHQRPVRANSPAGQRRSGAMKIVRRYVLISAGAGLITLPIVDVSALAAVHVALIKELTECYGHEFSEHAARNIVIAIGASLIPGSIGSILGRKLLRALPFVDPVTALATMSGFSAFVSYSLGRIFVEHFERGGTLENFDVEHLHDVLVTS
ncbi:MAG: DUF697 domain-containing protein [Acidobacteriota bacterium]